MLHKHFVSVLLTIFVSWVSKQELGRQTSFASMMQILFLPGVPKKNAHRLIWCKLKKTVFTRSTFLFSESSYFNLKFGIKQPKICRTSTEGWLIKPKILGPSDEQTRGIVLYISFHADNCTDVIENCQ